MTMYPTAEDAATLRDIADNVESMANRLWLLSQGSGVEQGPPNSYAIALRRIAGKIEDADTTRGVETIVERQQ